MCLFVMGNFTLTWVEDKAVIKQDSTDFSAKRSRSQSSTTLLPSGVLKPVGYC